MLPHKTARGQKALSLLSTYDGVPEELEKKKKMVVPSALKILRIKPNRKFCELGRLANEVGWKYGDLVNKLEEKRKIKSAAEYEERQAEASLREKAEEAAAGELKGINDQLAKYGYA